MSDEKISKLETDVSYMKSAVSSLVDKMDRSTEAQIALTVQIEHMVKGHDDISSEVKEVKGRVFELEKKDAVRDSGDKVMDYAKKAIVTTIVVAILGLVIING